MAENSQQPSSSPRERKGGILLAVAWSICALSLGAALYSHFYGSPSQVIAAGTIFVSLSLTLFVVHRLWKIEHVEVANWVLLNHTTPLLFVLLPPIFFALLFVQGAPEVTTGALPYSSSALSPRDSGPEAGTATATVTSLAPMSTHTEHQTPSAAPEANTAADKIAGIFFPSYYSLLVVVAALFIILQADIAVAIERIGQCNPASRNELRTWRLASSLCVLGALLAALLYVLPYVSDLKGELTHTMKLWLYAIAAVFVFMGPGAAIWLKLKLAQIDHTSTTPTGAQTRPESNYPPPSALASH